MMGCMRFFSQMLILIFAISCRLCLAASNCLGDGGTEICSTPGETWALCDVKSDTCDDNNAWCYARGGVLDPPDGNCYTQRCVGFASITENNT